MLVWVKDSLVLGHSDYHFRHEPLLYGYKAGGERRGRGADGWYGDDSQQSVLEVPRPRAAREHPTMKPAELVEICLRNSSRRSDLVLDAFAGSGSTMVAAERLGRRGASSSSTPPTATSPSPATSASPAKRPSSSHHPMARPTKLSAEVEEKIVRAIRAGNYPEVSARHAGVHPATYYRWMERGALEGDAAEDVIYRRFRSEVERAIADSEAAEVALIVKAARDGDARRGVAARAALLRPLGSPRPPRAGPRGKAARRGERARRRDRAPARRDGRA